jgi:hypothetical protein
MIQNNSVPKPDTKTCLKEERYRVEAIATPSALAVILAGIAVLTTSRVSAQA